MKMFWMKMQADSAPRTHATSRSPALLGLMGLGASNDHFSMNKKYYVAHVLETLWNYLLYFFN